MTSHDAITLSSHSVFEGGKVVSLGAQSLTRAWVGTVGTNALILVFGVGTGVLAARLLGPDDRGLFAAVMFWPALLAGIGFLSVGESAVYRSNHTSIERRRFAATLLVVAVLLALSAMVVGSVLLPSLLGAERAAALPLATAYLLAFIPLNFIALALLSIDQADQRFSRYNAMRLIPSATYLTALLVLWMLGAVSVSTALWASWLGTAVVAGVRLWLWRADLLARPAFGEAKALLKQAFGFHATTLIVLLAGQVDRIIVMRNFSDSEIGHYVVALTVATAGLGFVTGSVPTVLLPHLAAERNRERAISALRDGLRRTVLFLMVGSLSALLLIPYFLPLLFGIAFTPAVPIAAILILAFAPLALRHIVIRCIRAFGDAQMGVAVEATALIVFCLAVGPALSFYRLPGIALALLVANVVALAWLASSMNSRYGLHPGSWLLPNSAMLADLRFVIAHLRRIRVT